MTTLCRFPGCIEHVPCPRGHVDVEPPVARAHRLEAELAEAKSRGLKEFDAHQETIGVCDQLRETIRRHEREHLKTVAENNELVAERDRAEQYRADYKLLRASAERLAQMRLEIVTHDSNVIARLQAERDGALSEAAAAKRERDIARRGLDAGAINHIRISALSEEREACARVAEEFAGINGNWSSLDVHEWEARERAAIDIAAAIRSRSGQP